MKFSSAITKMTMLCVSLPLIASSSVTTIPLNVPRPLSALTIELQKRYGYLVSYEEAPIDEQNIETVIDPHGVPYRRPAALPVTFNVLESRSVMGQNIIPTLLPEIITPLIEQYHSSGNPGKFSALFEGGYAHIIPVTQVIGNKQEVFEPILSTEVTLSIKDQSCSDALNTLINQIETARGVTIAKGLIPIGPLLDHRCTAIAQGLPARDVLASLLEQVGRSPSYISSPARYSWALLFDINTGKYFLSTPLVQPNPDFTPPPPTRKAIDNASTTAVDSQPCRSRSSIPASRTPVPH